MEKRARRAALIVGVFLVGFLVFLKYWNSSDSKHSENPSQNLLSSQPAESPSSSPSLDSALDGIASRLPMPSSSGSPSSPSSPTPKESGWMRVLDLAPTLQEIRDQVRQDPHAPPLAMLHFAGELGEKLDEAMKSPEKASEFFSELKDCTLSPRIKTAHEIQALCLSNAERLARFYPESLGSPYQQLFQQADPEAKRLLSHQ